MRASRGMGKIKASKRPKKQPELNRVIGIDRLDKADAKSKAIGKRIPSQLNFGNMSKFR